MIKDVKTKNITQKDVDLKNIDSKSINIDTPRNYPIIEHTNNALLWPEKLKEVLILLIPLKYLLYQQILIHPLIPLKLFKRKE